MHKKQKNKQLQPMFIRLPKELKDQVQALAQAQQVSNAFLVATILDQQLNGTKTTHATVGTWLSRHD